MSKIGKTFFESKSAKYWMALEAVGTCANEVIAVFM
jgi:hypothetical protein